MKIISRNVNGIRAVIQKGFAEWVRDTQADIYCFQETKAFAHQVPPELGYIFADYDYCRHAGTRPGYAGTAIFRRKDIDISGHCNTFGDIEMFYEDGRVTQLDRGNYVLLNIYFPNGNPRSDGTEMLGYKLKFYDMLISYIHNLHQANKKVIVVGDYNICHTEIDIARPRENENSIGFLPIERQKVSQYLSDADMIDVFRYIYPEARDHYTRWSYRAGARPRNIGRRLDYATVSSALATNIINFEHQDMVLGSDHCPICLDIDI